MSIKMIAIKDGIIPVKPGLLLDAHLFSLLVPILFVCFFIIFRKKLINLSNEFQRLLSLGSSIVFFVLFGFSTYEYAVTLFNSQTSASTELQTIFYNVDTLLLVVFGALLLLNSLSLVRVLTPVAIIVGLANLINNPGAHITYVSAIANACLCVFPLLITLTRNKVSTFKELIVSLIFSLFFLLFVSIVNAFEDSTYSLISVKSLSTNEVYKLIPTGALKIAIFIVLILVSQTTAWIIIKAKMMQVSFWSVLLTIKSDIKRDKQILVNTKQDLAKSFFDFETPEFFEDDLKVSSEFDSIEQILLRQNEFETEYTYNYHSVNLPELHGARSPSL